MKIDWNPSPAILLKIQRVAELKKTKTYEQIAEIFKNHRTYIIGLMNWYKAHTEAFKEKENGEKQDL